MCIYAFVKRVIIDLNKVFSSVRSQGSTWANADLLSTGRLETNFNEILNKVPIFMFAKNAFLNIVY